MGITSGIVVFVLVWWSLFFCILPIGITQSDEAEPGAMPGAPENPDLRRKIIWTTAASLAVWLGIYLLISADLFSFRD